MSVDLPVHLVFPRSRGEISGGHIYNERLAEGLAERGALSVLSIDELEGELARGTAGCFVLDSLDLERVETLPVRGAQQAIALIAHHLPSLDCFGDEATEARAVAQARERLLLARLDLVVATGAFARDYLRTLGVPESRIALIPPAAPPHVSSLARPEMPPVRALLVANVIPRKGVIELLETIAVELRSSDVFELAIVGRLDLDPVYGERCVSYVASTPLSGVVRFVGAVPPNEIGDHYAQAHVLVSPSRMETFGMALQEARCSGVPILAFDAGNAAEHVSVGNGQVFMSIADLALGLLELVRRPDELRRLLVRAEAARPDSTHDWGMAAVAFLDACARTTPARL